MIFRFRTCSSHKKKKWWSWHNSLWTPPPLLEIEYPQLVWTHIWCMLGDRWIVCTCRTLTVVNICVPPWGRRWPGVPQLAENAGFEALSCSSLLGWVQEQEKTESGYFETMLLLTTLISINNLEYSSRQTLKANIFFHALISFEI